MSETPIKDAVKQTGSNVWQFVKHYTYGLFAKSFNGGISAMDAFIGLSVGAAVTTDITKPNWQAALAVFAVSFLRSGLTYFRDHPLPEKLPVVETITETTTRSTTPPHEESPATPPVAPTPVLRAS